MPESGMHDSGTRQQFTTGAQRDTAAGKPMLSLVSPFALRRLGRWCTLGAEKYSPRNWEKGMPFSRVVDALERHTQAFKAGEQDEDHLAAVMWNAMALIHYEEMIQRGILPTELNDMPDYGKASKINMPGLSDYVQKLREEYPITAPDQVYAEQLQRIQARVESGMSDADRVIAACQDVAYLKGEAEVPGQTQVPDPPIAVAAETPPEAPTPETPPPA